MVKFTFPPDNLFLIGRELQRNVRVNVPFLIVKCSIAMPVVVVMVSLPDQHVNCKQVFAVRRISIIAAKITICLFVVHTTGFV